MNARYAGVASLMLMLGLSGCVIYVDESGDADFHMGIAKVQSDQTLADRVAGKMQNDDLLSQEDIKVRARSGSVILDGKVDNVAVIDRAIKVAASTEGVDSVKSRLQVEVTN